MRAGWRNDYRKQVAELHAPERHTYVAVAEADGTIVGYVAWSVAPVHKKGVITILAVSAQHRRHHVGRALCEYAFEEIRALGAGVVEIGTGGDQFHAPARALYEALGCTPLPLTVYFRQLRTSRMGAPGRPSVAGSALARRTSAAVRACRP
ncbi:GNAT family N-acetyltransferase [Streptomyces sp. NPDC087512]|uniref:GNAT family N-acetyltransferase n=1 Tax=Streptomyces sp. NPDC087512 TaxID=3155059 RepID=UPI00342A1C53